MTKKKVDYFFNSVQTNGKTELTISGAIGESSYFYEATSAKDVREALENATGDIHIYLNSGGGDVFQGIEIYNYLKNISNNVTVEVTGTACSAASIIAMGANKLIMNTGTSLMIHEASTIAWGNKNEIKKTWFTADEAVELGFADEKKSEVKADENMENILTNDFIENLFKNETFVQKVSSMVNNNVLDNKEDEETINNNGFFL